MSSRPSFWRRRSFAMASKTSGSAACRVRLSSIGTPRSPLAAAVERADLVDATLVAPAGERRGEEGLGQGLGVLGGDDARAQRQDVGGVVLARQAHAEEVGAVGGAHA